jgi:hypothetical protein
MAYVGGNGAEEKMDEEMWGIWETWDGTEAE